jgi:hypothetical protein
MALQLDCTSRKNREVLKAEIMLPWTPRVPLSKFLGADPASQLHHLPIVFNLLLMLHASCSNNETDVFTDSNLWFDYSNLYNLACSKIERSSSH